YEPVLQLYAVDRTPSAIEPFLAGADLERLTAGRWRLVRPNPPASALANGPTQLRLDTRGCSPSTNLDACYRRTATPPTVGGGAAVPHVFPPRCSDFILHRPDSTPATQPAVRSAAIVDLTSGVAPWLTFAGAWGDGNYILLRQVASGRARYTHLRVGESPPGP